jgi:hypothetical protein
MRCVLVISFIEYDFSSRWFSLFTCVLPENSVSQNSESLELSIDQNTGSDLIVEDLELCDNYFSINSQHGDHRHQRFTHVNRKKHSSNQDLKIKNSSDSEFCETEFSGRTHVKRENHLEEKSYSMNDITKTHLIQNDSLASRMFFSIYMSKTLMSMITMLRID